VNKLKQFITARRVSLGLILVLAGLMYLSTIIPQWIDSTPEKIEAWRRGHSGLVWMVDICNLHSIYSQPWFAAAILVAAVTLGVSSCDQLKIIRSKLSSTASASTDLAASGITEQYLSSVARSHRYRHLRTSEGQLKFVRNPWGYFGNLLLHLGMTVVITVSLYVALTARQGALILVEGKSHGRGQPWNVSEHGLFASPLQLPGAEMRASLLLLPAATTTTAPAATASVTANCDAVSQVQFPSLSHASPPRLRFITRAGFGLSGTPDSGHWSSAASSASWARSSASPTSRTIRVSPAMSRADSILQTASIAR